MLTRQRVYIVSVGGEPQSVWRKRRSAEREAVRLAAEQYESCFGVAGDEEDNFYVKATNFAQVIEWNSSMCDDPDLHITISPQWLKE